MGTLHEMFPASPEFTIYIPLNASDDDEFEAITIPDDSLSRGTIYQGDVVTIWLGFIDSEGLHAVITPTGDKYVGFLVDKGNGLISIETNDDDYEPDIFRREEVEILGRVWQVYPGGDTSQRWELIRSERAVARRAAK